MRINNNKKTFMFKLSLKKSLIILVIFTLLLSSGAVFISAQATPEQERSNLQRQLKELEELERKIQVDVAVTQAERERIQHQVSTVRRRINQLNAEIRQAQIRAQSLTGQIINTEASIEVTVNKIDTLRGRLANTLRNIYQEDQRTTVEILLSEKDLSGFFDNTSALERLSSESRDILGEIIVLKVNLEEEKISLGDARTETEQLAAAKTAQAREAEAIRREQQRLLEGNQQREALQKKELEEVRKQAAQIRARIFELAGTPSTQAPNFGEAYELAKWVEGITGTRPAFLLAILQQESAIGRNVGGCNIADTTSGHSVNIRTGQVHSNGIHRTRDLPGLLIIANELNTDPLKIQISCPVPNIPGFGGAMGPAQFIPSTWMGYRSRLSTLLGKPANPWVIRDSFLASGLLLSDLGARSQTREGEWRAAISYYAGPNCLNSQACINRNRSYADQVMGRVAGFQRDIDILNQSR